jgi:diketogulonate reductase-like aldo/keto reductase
MKYETLHDIQVPKIGFGTWKIGGGTRSDPSQDSVSLIALRSALENGYSHFDTAEYYAGGHAEELLRTAIQDTDTNREGLFITSKVSPPHLHYEEVLKSCENSLRRLGTDYLDLYLIHWRNPRIELEETFRALNRLVREGKVKHLGVSNFNLKYLKEAQLHSETPLLTDQVPYRLPDKKYVENGVLEFCQENDILLTAYSPLKFRNLNVNKTIRAIADAHNASTAQIALAWLIAQPRVITIPMSLNPDHIAENIAAAEVRLSPSEMAQLGSLYQR